MDMRINFLDKEFPKEFISKLYELDNLINKLFNLKSYRFEFDIDWLFYCFTLNFENFTLCFNLKIGDMRNLKNIDILRIFDNGLQSKINEIYYNNRGVINE